MNTAKTRQPKPFLTGTAQRKNPAVTQNMSSTTRIPHLTSSSQSIAKVVLSGSLPSIQKCTQSSSTLSMVRRSHNLMKSVPVGGKSEKSLTSGLSTSSITKQQQQQQRRRPSQASLTTSVAPKRRQQTSISLNNNKQSSSDNKPVERSDTFTKQQQQQQQQQPQLEQQHPKRQSVTQTRPNIARRPSKSQSLWVIQNHTEQASVWRKFSSVSQQIVPKAQAKTFTTSSQEDSTHDEQSDKTVSGEDSQSFEKSWNQVRPRSFSFSTLSTLEPLENEPSESEVQSQNPKSSPEDPTSGNELQRASTHHSKSTCDVQTSPTLPRMKKCQSMTSVGTQVELDSTHRSSDDRNKVDEMNLLRKSRSTYDNREPDWEFELDSSTGRLVKKVLPALAKTSVSSPTSYTRHSLVSSCYSSGLSDFQACQRCKGSHCCATIPSTLSSRKSSLAQPGELDEFYSQFDSSEIHLNTSGVSYRRRTSDTIPPGVDSTPDKTHSPKISHTIDLNSNPNSGVDISIERQNEILPKTFHNPQHSTTTLTKIDKELGADIGGLGGALQAVASSASALKVSQQEQLQLNRNDSILTGSYSQLPEENNRFEALLRDDTFLHNATYQAKQQRENVASRKPSTFDHFKSVPTGPMQAMDEHSQGVNCLELSDDRSLLVSGGEDGILRLWSTLSTPCECIGVLVGHLSYITCATVYKLLVISGSADCTLKLWSIEDGNCLMTLKGHTAFINRVTCAGPLLLSSSFDATVRVWVLVDNLTIIQHENIRRPSDLSIQSKTSGGNSSNVPSNHKQQNSTRVQEDAMESALLKRTTLNFTFGAHLQTLEGHEKSVTHVALVPNEVALLESGILQELDILVTTSTDGTARTWCLTDGEHRHTLLGHSGSINCLVSDPNEGQIIYTAGSDAVIKCWDIVTGELLRDLKGHQGAILCLISNNRILYSCSADHTVRAWAMEFGQCTRIYYRNTSAVTCCAYLRGILYTGSNDHCARIYDANSGVLRQTYGGHENAISAIAVVPGKLFTASYDGRILVWDVSAIQNEIASGTDGEGSKAQGAAIGDSKKAPNGLSSRIGATILNSTLDIFTQDYAKRLKNGSQGKRTKSTLYPHLRRKFSTSQAEVTAKKVIRKTLGDKKEPKDAGDSGRRNSWFGAVCNNRLWSRKSSTSTSTLSGDKLVDQMRGISVSKSRPTRHKQGANDLIDPNVMAFIEQTRAKKNNRTDAGGMFENVPHEDSVNVQRAVTALEPYLRSFK